jgi:hypothetical protein
MCVVLLESSMQCLDAVSVCGRGVSPQYLSPKFANLRGKVPLCEPIGAKEMFHTFLLLDIS